MSIAASEPEFVAAQTTLDSRESAHHLASAAVQARLVACVQVSVVSSFYRWDGGVENDEEHLLTFKTTAAAVPGLRDLLGREHPYDEPEFIVLPIVDGSESYLEWIRESVTVS